MNYNKSNSRYLLPLVLGLCFGMFMISPAFAAAAGKSIDWFEMTMTLLGGLAIFLYGMELMTDALKAVAGDRMKVVLEKLTGNRIAGVLTGAGVTAVVQSSSVTTVIVVGFVTAGLMNLSQAIGVIFGANIGTTITAQIVAFKITKYALLMVAVGFAMMMLGRKEQIKHWGFMLMGLGLVFFGMGVMSGAMKPLRTFQPFLDLMTTMENPLVGILIAAVFTGLVQSSSATTGIVIVMATEGLVSLPAGIALAFGANIGTCVTALLAAIGKPRVAVQASLAHLLFNVLGVVIWFFFIPYLADFVVWLSPAADPSLTGQAKLAAEAPRQIANAHTVFNVANTIIFLPFATLLAKLVERLAPLKKETFEEKAISKFRPQYLDEGMLDTPPLALSMVRREARRMGEVVEEMLSDLPSSLFSGDTDKMSVVVDKDNQVDALYASINSYLTRVTKRDLMEGTANEAMMLTTTATEIENIGDIIETHMSHLASMCAANDIAFNDDDLAALQLFHSKVQKAFRSAMVAVEHDRRAAAQMVLDQEEDIVEGMDIFIIDRQRKFLHEEHTPQEMAAFTLMADIMENLKRIFEHSKRIGKLVLKQEGGTSILVVD
ncbi:MAG: Na/Pi cotransporter family protein [Gammaproteobacteria bacterium]|nr:Na/Pi cotransporter family protein [Gammaproteobacteria bacterium]